jgi:hypothetical protein
MNTQIVNLEVSDPLILKLAIEYDPEPIPCISSPHTLLL